MPLWDNLHFVTFPSPYPPQQRLFKGSAWDIVVAKRANYNPISVRLHMSLRSSLRLLCKLAVKETLFKYSTYQKFQAGFKRVVSRLHFLDLFSTGDRKTFCPIIALKNSPLNQLKTRTSQRCRHQVRSNPCEGVPSGFSMDSFQFEGILLLYVNSVVKSLLCALTHTKNALVELWRRYHRNFIKGH